jgi:NAD-dependent SIR2 family protein deacetylase
VTTGPAAPLGSPSDAPLVELLADGGVVVLSGAGISTGSGIPDYRGPSGRHRTRQPMQWHEFADDRHARRRYWARGQVGFRRHAGVAPNPAHHAVVALEQAGLVDHVVTQNVDGLHQAAGSRAVTEVHGSLAEVLCMDCGEREPRPAVAARLDTVNPWIADVDAAPLADGDAVLDDDLVGRFELVGCLRCEGDLRPDVVFFGEFVPRERMARARAAVEAATTVLVVGSSLSVGSGFLLLRAAARRGATVAIATSGPTRADGLAAVRSHEDLVTLLPRVAAAALDLAPTEVSR